MLDLKAKLLAAGLVTKEQADKATADKARKRRPKGKGTGNHKNNKNKNNKRRPKPQSPDRTDALWKKRVERLAKADKSEQYETIRKWVDRTRLDGKKSALADDAERFHFTKFDDGGIAWLTINPELAAKLKSGEAGIVAFMSNAGLAHCLVPKDVAADVGVIRPEWVRVLDGFQVWERTAVLKKPEPSESAEPVEPTENKEKKDV